MAKCIVLRDLQRGNFTDPVEGPVIAALDSTDPRFPPEPLLEIEDMDWQERTSLLRDPQVRAIAPAMQIKLIEPVAMAEHGGGQAWGVEAVGALSTAFTGSDVVIAVLDTGIDNTHPAFQGLRIVEKDFCGDGNGDRQGHGTHCAGTIFGRDVNGHRIGVATGVNSVLIGKVLGDDGRGSSEMLFNALTWASESHADVISMSLGFDFPGQVERLISQGWPADLATSSTLEAYRGNVRVFDKIMEMIRARHDFSGGGGVVVAASGNESKRDIRKEYVISASLPAAAQDVISVGAVARCGAQYDIASFSNTLPELCAPGVDILSAKVGGGLIEMSGTSMACPHAAGIAALWWQFVRERGLPPKAATVRSRMTASARIDCLTAGVQLPDRGAGFVTAP